MVSSKSIDGSPQRSTYPQDLATAQPRDPTSSPSATKPPRRDGRNKPRLSFAQAACYALLASPLGAAARTLAVPRARNLQECQYGEWSGALVAHANSFDAPASVQRVATPDLWLQQRSNTCVAGGTESRPAQSVTYSFNNTKGTASAYTLLDESTREVLRQDIATLTQSINLGFEEVDGTVISNPNIVFLNNFGVSGVPSWVGTPLGYFKNQTAAVIRTQVAPGNTERLAALGSSLGLVYPGMEGFDGSSGVPGNFAQNSLSSVTFNAENTCVNVTRFGPLDLAALVIKYGIATVLGLDDISWDLTGPGNEAGGMVLGPTQNTISAQYTGTVPLQVSMLDDGLWPTVVGTNTLLLAPGSAISIANISQTLGGAIIGNNVSNSLVGSPYTDYFRLGAGISEITTGGGNDEIIAFYPGTQMTIRDYTAGTTIWLPSETSVTPLSSTLSGTGIRFELPSNISISLLNTADFNVSTHVKAGYPNAAINWFQAAPCAQISAPPAQAPAPPAPPSSSGSSGGFNPCSHVGDDGDGGAGYACSADIGQDFVNDVEPWNP